MFCRLVITNVDTFLYGKYKNKLLIAVVMDRVDHIMAFVYALMDEEVKDTWSLFLHWLPVHVIKRIIDICLISDCHASMKKVVKTVMQHDQKASHSVGTFGMSR